MVEIGCTSIKKGKRIDVMVDLESLSTRRDAAVFQIAMEAFNLGVWDSLPCKWANINVFINPTELARMGYDIEERTIKWWLTQESFKDVFCRSVEEKNDIFTQLGAVCAYIAELRTRYEEVYFWGRPAMSDFTWLKDLFAKAEVPYPIEWYEMRCLSTIGDMYRLKTGLAIKDLAESAITHDASDDCSAQVDMAIKAYSVMSFQTGDKE